MHEFKLALSQLDLFYNECTLEFENYKQSDLPYIKKIYASTRVEELNSTNWDDKQKNQFIEHQFNAQHTHYTTHFAQAELLLIKQQNQIIGRIYLDRNGDIICLIDITLLPEFRHQKIGNKILAGLIEYAQLNQFIITLHVENQNPAYLWYLKNGFKNIEDRGVYQYLEWHPEN